MLYHIWFCIVYIINRHVATFLKPCVWGGGVFRIILKTLIIKKEKINSQTMKILSRNPTTQLGQWLLYNGKRGCSLDWILEQIQEDEDVINLVRRRRQKKAARRRRTWVRQWLDFGRRFHFGQYHRLMPELWNEDPASFF